MTCLGSTDRELAITIVEIECLFPVVPEGYALNIIKMHQRTPVNLSSLHSLLKEFRCEVGQRLIVKETRSGEHVELIFAGSFRGKIFIRVPTRC